MGKKKIGLGIPGVPLAQVPCLMHGAVIFGALQMALNFPDMVLGGREWAVLWCFGHFATCSWDCQEPWHR